MLTTLLTVMLASYFRPCQATPVFEKHYYGSYVPQTVETSYGLQVVAPNSPYIAAAGVNKLYFIDKRFDEETAFQIKQQIERASIPRSGEYIKLDELAGTAEVRSSVTNETLFTFDPPYARVFFARGMNKHNPALKLVEHEPPGNWMKAYDLGGRLSTRAVSLTCEDEFRDCSDHADCNERSNGNCPNCATFRLAKDCTESNINAGGICHKICKKAVDTPRLPGETNTQYFQRMDELHWGN